MFFLLVFQHLAEALGPLFKEKEKLLSDYNSLKVKLDREYEQQAEWKRKYQQETETLYKTSSKIKEYVLNPKFIWALLISYVLIICFVPSGIMI